MEYLLFAAYLLFFCWLITRIRFFKAAGLSQAQLIILFLIKILGGIFYGWMGVYYGEVAKMLDTWSYHYQGLLEYKLLLTDPWEYATNLFRNGYDHGYARFLGTSNSYWNDIKLNSFIKLISIFDIFSFGYYYVNIIFYSFLSFFGPVAFYKVMKDMLPSKKTELLLAIFIAPSFIYWCSGLHKEGILFTGIGLIIYHTYCYAKEKKRLLKRMLGVIAGMLILLLLRNFVLVALLPAWGAWVLSILWPGKTKWVYATVATGSIVLFFTTRYLFPSLDLPAAVVEKQQAFMQLSGKTSVPITPLEPTAASFLKTLPQAISLSSLRPWPSDVIHLPSMAAAAETILIWLMVLLSAVFHLRQPGANRPLVYFLLFFTIIQLLSIGYSVNNLGAIVRYRSLIIPIALSLIVVYTDFTRLRRLAMKFIKINNNI